MSYISDMAERPMFRSRNGAFLYLINRHYSPLGFDTIFKKMAASCRISRTDRNGISLLGLRFANLMLGKIQMTAKISSLEFFLCLFRMKRINS